MHVLDPLLLRNPIGKVRLVDNEVIMLGIVLAGAVQRVLFQQNRHKLAEQGQLNRYLEEPQGHSHWERPVFSRFKEE